MPFTSYLENKLLDHCFGANSYNKPATVYVGLCTGVTAGGVITGEPTTNNYARVAITNGDASTWANAANGVKTNVNAMIQFPMASGDWGTLTKFFISDSATGDTNTLLYGDLTSPVSVALNDQPVLSPGQVTLTLV